jgi:tetratricopeptide (TPR) repeat protein
MSISLRFASLCIAVAPSLAVAQGAPAASRADSLRLAAKFDTEGSSARARTIYMNLIESAPDPLTKMQAQRALAISYAFTGDCLSAAKAEDQAIDYWKTREQAEPQNAFFQQGEIANEAARICIDAGALPVAERYYRLGHELGLKEPEPRKNPKSLWDYRLAHAMARIAARNGNRAEAFTQVTAARKLLDGDSAMAAAQERYFPYLTGYVAYYGGDLKTAEADFMKAISLQGNAGDPFFHCLLAMTYEKMGRTEKAKEGYRKAYDLAVGHNPPAAFTRPYARKKIAALSAPVTPP